MKNELRDCEFQQINRIISNTSRFNSSLYRLIEDLLQENNILMTDQTYEIKSNPDTGREYIIFKFQLSPDIVENFKCIECHLSIDKIYATDNTKKGASGFSMAHYTEYYYNSIIEQTIVVHCYFNDFGKYNYVQIKPLKSTQSDSQFNISNELQLKLISIINKSHKPVEQFLCKLLIEKSERYVKHIQNAYELEENFKKH